LALARNNQNQAVDELDFGVSQDHQNHPDVDQIELLPTQKQVKKFVKLDIKDADEDADTLKLSGSLLKSTPSVKKLERQGSDSAQKSLKNGVSHSTTTSMFNSVFTHESSIQKLRGNEDDDDMVEVVKNKQDSLKKRRNGKADEKNGGLAEEKMERKVRKNV
jgi:hypothetical protein